MLALAVAAPSLAATRARLATVGAPLGGVGAGSLSNPRGVAVNETGAGGVTAGEVYTADQGNNRIAEFSASGSFVRAWGMSVVPGAASGTANLTSVSGTGNLTANSTSVSVTSVTGSFSVGQTITGSGILPETTITVVGAGTLTLSRPATATGTGVSLTAGEVTNVVTKSRAFVPGQVVTGAGIPAGTRITAFTSSPGVSKLTLSNAVTATAAGVALTAAEAPGNVPVNEQQTVTVSATGGTFTLSFASILPTASPTPTTAAIAYNATALEVQEKLEALSNLGAGNVQVTGGPGDELGTSPYVIEFQGGLADTNVAQLTANSGALTGGVHVAVPGTARQGATAPETCSTVCGAGAASTAAGGVNGGASAGIAEDRASGNIFLHGSNNAALTKRVDVFSAKGTFAGAFGWNVISSGAAGTGTLTAGKTEVSSVVTTSKVFQVGQRVTGTGISPGTTIEQVGTNTNTLVLSQAATASGAGIALTALTGVGNVPQNEKQTVTVGGAPTGGTFTLSFKAPAPSEAPATTGPINFDAGAVEVRERLEALTNIGVGNVEVSGAAGGPWTVEFKGTRYADTNVIEMTGSGAALTPSGTVTVATLRDGGALEFCTLAGGCLNGESTGSAGGFANSAATPRQPAVDASGKVYVPDPGNLRIDVFSPILNGSGEVTGVAFVRAFGWRVDAATPEEKLQECTAFCQKGSEGSGSGQFRNANPTSLAIDSAGNLYADSNGNCATTAPCRVQKFNTGATPIAVADPSFGPLSGECSTSASTGFTNNSSSGVQAIGMDWSSGHLLAIKRSSLTAARVCEYDGAGAQVSIFPGQSFAVTGFGGLMGGTGERVYVSEGGTPTAAGGLYIFGPVPPPSCAEVVSVTNITQTTAELNGKVCVPAPGGEGFDTTYRFEVSADEGASWAKVPASDVSVGSTAGTFEVHQPLTGLQPHLAYLVRIVATAGGSITSPEKKFLTAAAPPSASYPAITAPLVTETTAKLKGFVNPNNSPTTYRFEFGPTASYGDVAPEFEPFIGSGGTATAAAATLTGLQPGTTYHYRLVAINSGAAGTGTTNAEDREFTTAAARQDLNSAGLPDGRRFELVSPADKRPQGFVGTKFDNFLCCQAAESGNALLFPLLNGIEGTDSGGDASYLARRTEVGWESVKISPPSLVQAPTTGTGGEGGAGSVVYSSADLSCSVVNTFNPLTEDTPAADVELGVYNLYRRSPDGSHTLLTGAVPANPGVRPPPPSLPGTVAGASSDCEKVYFRSPYVYLAGATGLYEWDDGMLRDAGLLPDGSAPVGLLPGSGSTSPVAFGGEYPDVSSSPRGSRANSVSTDGRLFFSAVSNAPGTSGTAGIFVRKGAGAVEEASRKQGGSKDSLGAFYEIASRDGKHVFFTATYGLTPTSSSGPAESCANAPEGSLRACDLYDYAVDTGELTDLSADGNAADTKGSVVEGVVGVSEDGSSVYFVARGQLVPGQGKTYAQNISGTGSSNLYLIRDGQLHYVATVAAADLSGLLAKSNGWSAEVTPDGKHLLFGSRANASGGNSGVLSVYLYAADTGIMQCVSCGPSGPTADGATLIGSFPHGLNSQSSPRKVSDDGKRVFFTSSDVLASGAVDGNKNLYEWEQGQIYLLSSVPASVNLLAPLGASNSGDDLFFVTSDRLDAHDTDFVPDAYDVRVGGGFPPPAPPPPGCDPAVDCQGTPGAAPGAPTPASGSFSGPGNPPVTPRRCRKGEVRRNGRCHKKKRRHRHHRAANTNNGGAK